MLRLAILSARGRLGTFTGALVALTAAAVLAMAWGMQLEAVLRAHPPVERYAGAAAVISGRQKVGTDHDVFLSERARVSSALTTRLASLPGVRAAIGDVSVPARLGGRATAARRPGRRPSSSPPRLAADRDIPNRLRGSATGRSPGTARRDRRARRPWLRRLAAARRRRRCAGADRRCTRAGGASRASADADHVDPGHGSVRGAGGVHRDVRRGEHDGSVDTAARAGG